MSLLLRFSLLFKLILQDKIGIIGQILFVKLYHALFHFADKLESYKGRSPTRDNLPLLLFYKFP